MSEGNTEKTFAEQAPEAVVQTKRSFSIIWVVPIIALLIGGWLLLIADTFGPNLLEPSGIPAGIMAALIGAPYFIFLLLKNTHAQGVERVLERFWEKAQKDVAFQEPPFTTETGRVADVKQLARLMGEA